MALHLYLHLHQHLQLEYPHLPLFPRNIALLQCPTKLEVCR